jgi:hypothetical protein
MTIVKFIHGAVRSISRVRAFWLIAGLTLSVVAAEARPYQLGWDRNQDGVTAGYRVYYGTSPGTYQPSQGVDVGNVQLFTVDLTPGMSYYFAVRAYNASGTIGPPSAELRFTVPLGASITVNTASVSPGATISATITNGPGGLLDWVGLFPAGAASTGSIDWRYLNGSRLVPTLGLTSGTVSFTAPNTPGSYEVRFYSTLHVLLGSSVPITVTGSPSVTALPATVNPGQNIAVAVSNGPANRSDWVALYRTTNTNPTSYVDWKYLNGLQSLPATGIANGNVTFSAPMQSGQYFVRFMLTNGTVLATSSTITVASSTATSVTPSATTLTAGSSLIAQIANGPAGRYDWVGLFAVGASNASSVARFYLNGTLNPPATGASTANVSFTAPQQTGQYNLRFFPNNGTTPTATSVTITVTSAAPPPSGSPTVTPSATSVLPGSNVTAQVRNGPAARLDWVALYPSGASNSAYIDWFYLNGSKVAPSTGVASANIAFRMPTNAGEYRIRLFSNGSHTLLSTSVAINVVGSTAPTITPSATTVARGSIINVTVANGTGSRYDWVGIYTPNNTGSAWVDWVYLTGTKVAPVTGSRNATFTYRMPSTPGTYVLRFYANGSGSSTAWLANSVAIVVQ